MRLIDADALKTDLTRFYDGVVTAKQLIDEQPTIVTEPVRRGRWIDHGGFVTCSVCNEEQYGIDTGRFYCPNCGAKMDMKR